MSKPNKNKIYLSSFLLIFCMLLFIALYGCGTGPDGASGSTPTPTPTVGSGTIALSFSASSVNYPTPVTVTATVTDGNGAAVSGVVVTFAAGSTLVAFTPTSATALTNGSGIATIILNSASFDSAGATSITASASVTTGSTTATVTSAPVGISVGGATVTLGTLTLGQPSISAYGTSSVSVPVLVNGSAATIPISVTFTSPCVTSVKATLTSPVTTILGTATSTYKDNNCASGTDVITASVTGATASATITVALPAANNMQFVSATPTIIGIKGSPLPQSSLVKFQVVDINNNGVPAVVVDFTLLPDSAPGGITLSAASATSDANGYVTTSVNSGTVPTPVWVVAKLHSNPAILSQSNTLTITTGLPTQNFFSLSVQTFNIEGWEYDGVTSTLTIIASDRLGNPIPNGTVINFITEGSQITPASCTTTNGTCTVTFRSSDERPTDGRVTILAYAVGEKGFIDANGNNIYTAGETFYDLGDLYIDANENGHWDTGEMYLAPYLSAGSSACLTQPGGTALPPSYSNVPSKDNTCDATWGTNYVRRSQVMVLSSSEPDLSPTTVSMASTCTRQFDLMLTDINGNPMPAGTTVATANNLVYYTPSGTTPPPTKATVSILYGTPVVNTNALGGTSITLQVESPPDCATYPVGNVDITTMTPKSISNRVTVTVN
jgi:hypothetical protein